ncbi:hypothetical protein [Chryseobacterium balustinum]|uniref:hypothetical protein n=1 Tax=Chryseobacterium balustinum TaxID=246 RepID=UPI003CF39196
MEKAKEFILEFLDKEAECWTRLNSNELDAFNQVVREFRNMAIERVEKGLGISERIDFGIFTRTEKEIAENPLINKPRHLYKLSAYKNKMYDEIWVAYVSTKNPIGEPNKSVFSNGFIMSEIDNEFKIIGIMGVKLNNLTMNVTGWKGNIYNPSGLDIKKLGKFVSTERYSEPDNRDDFSLNEYLKDK